MVFVQAVLVVICWQVAASTPQTLLDTAAETLTMLVSVSVPSGGQHSTRFETVQSVTVADAPFGNKPTVVLDAGQPLAPESVTTTFARSTLPLLCTVTWNVRVFVEQLVDGTCGKTTVPPELNGPPLTETDFAQVIDGGAKVTVALALADTWSPAESWAETVAVSCTVPITSG